MPFKANTQKRESGTDARGLADQLRSNSPDEVLGAMNQASLTQGIIMASAVTVVLLVVLTIGPYLLGSGSPKKKGAKPAAAAQNKEQSPAAAQDAADENAAAGDDSATAKAGAGGDPKANAKALKNLGVDDVKKSNPKKNPFENAADDLLKDIK